MFYNPDMAVDRDVGVAFARARFGPGALRGWEMLAATGARGLRLLVESEAFGSILLTEAHPEGVEVLRQNAAPHPGATVREADARVVPGEAPFDYVDLDPYGSPLPFVTTAIRSVAPGGVLAVTATDLMVLAGAQPKACERRYGSRPVRGRLGPEGGLRILIAHLIGVAETLGRVARPVLAYVRGHHLRVFVQLDGDPVAPGSVGTAGDGAWDGPALGPTPPYGPMWLGALFDPGLVARLTVPSTAAHPKDLARFFEVLREEVHVDRPFYYESNELAQSLRLPFPPSAAAFEEALRARGHRFARTHARPEGFRTDAPRPVVEAVAVELGRRPSPRP